jgi:uncharacterized protein (DUF58 family)
MGNFIVFIIILFILAALLRIDFFFTILYLFLGVYILSQIWSRRVLHQLVITRSMVSRAFSGDQVEVTLRLTNHSRLPIPWLMVSESLPIDLHAQVFREVVSLRGNGFYEGQYLLSTRKRGYYKVGPLELRTGDILGLRKELIGRFAADTLIVYPRIIPITDLGLPAHSPQVILPTASPLFPDPSRLSGVRSYTPGDNPRHIHWPATATTGQMLVKQFQPAIARDNVIFLDFDRSVYAKKSHPDTAIELAIVVAASLAHHISSVEKLPVGLTTTALDPLLEKIQPFHLPPAKGQGQLMQILEVLARIQAVDDSQFLSRLHQAAVHLSWGTTLIIITSHATPALQQTSLLLKRAGFQVTVVLVAPPRYRPELRPEPESELDSPVFRISRERDIEIWAQAT